MLVEMGVVLRCCRQTEDEVQPRATNTHFVKRVPTR
jgi:hypothetical protein